MVRPCPVLEGSRPLENKNGIPVKVSVGGWIAA
jgi:hypothetical protein